MFLSSDKIKKTMLVLAFFATSFQSFFGQCAMCRASLQNEANSAKAVAVNNGIVYLMIIPYVLVAIMFYAIYKMRQKKKNISNIN